MLGSYNFLKAGKVRCSKVLEIQLPSFVLAWWVYRFSWYRFFSVVGTEEAGDPSLKAT
jgi:hypothetical protein